MLIKILKKVVYSLGFSIKRNHQGKKVVFAANARPLYIEFVGVSGVGKSTLYRAMQAHQKAGEKWMERLVFLGYQPKIHIDDIISTTYLRILENKTEKIWRSALTNLDKIKLLSFFYQNIQEEAATLLYNKNATIINEDGIFHNFQPELLDIYNNDLQLFRELAKDRAIVYCTNSAENIAKQIGKRQFESNENRPHHKVKTLEELLAIQNTLLQETSTFVKTLEEISVPVLVLNTADDLSENVRRVNLFINEMQGRGIK